MIVEENQRSCSTVPKLRDAACRTDAFAQTRLIRSIHGRDGLQCPEPRLAGVSIPARDGASMLNRSVIFTSIGNSTTRRENGSLSAAALESARYRLRRPSDDECWLSNGPWAGACSGVRARGMPMKLQPARR